MGSERPLSALLSQLLVAFTVELNGEFERRMGQAGYPGSLLSLAVWTDLLRFVGEGVTVRELTARANAPDTQIKHQLGCLERWGFVVLGRDRPDGWGSGRGIRADSIVGLSVKGMTARTIWPPLFEEIELRWERRFGKPEIQTLRQLLLDMLATLDPAAPRALPCLLSGLLEAFRQEFDRESPVPLLLCANTLRVLGEQPIPAADLPRLTGGSRETSDIGWQLKPFVVIAPDPAASRGKLISLSLPGVLAQHTYRHLTVEIEKRWQDRFGKQLTDRLRESLQAFFNRRGKVALSLSEGLLPPPGTVRAGDQAPALGRRDIGAAARQRRRDLMAQTEAFVRDPVGSLPHYPMWDMNRGFGP